jgi:exosome complex RNA-binding protein Rrp4
MVQNMMVRQANQRRNKRTFHMGDYVYLKLQPYRQISVAIRSSRKIAVKYYRPYMVLEKIVMVAYRLDLPYQ